MLPRSRKLPSKEVFAGRGKNKAKTGPFLVYWKDNGTERNRFGVSISRKTEASAVKRNRIKRAVYSWLVTEKDKGKDFLVVALPEFKKTPKKDAKESLKKTISTIK